MRASRTSIVIAGLAAFTMALAGCGSKANNSGNSNSSAATTPASTGTGAATTPTTTAAAGGSLKACMVLDTGGVDDKSFNQSSWDGMQAANKSNPNIQISYVPSNSGNDYTPNLKAEVTKGCQAVIAVGGLMSANVETVAKANPSVHFAEVDAGSSAPNVYGIQFNTAQAAFLGGYLAAGMTKSGKVATWGGLNIPPVTIYMDGFWEGVQYYNQQNHKNVQVLGWNEHNQKGGTFVGGNNAFTDQNKGKQISQTFIQQGADVIFPVAGGSGLGAGAAAQDSNGRANVMWVDTDGCVSAAQYCKYFITSVTKNLSGSVTQYVEAAASGNFPTGSYIGTLQNNGVGLAPYHEFQSKIPQALQTQLDQVKQDITSGKITITSPSQPKS